MKAVRAPKFGRFALFLALGPASGPLQAMAANGGACDLNDPSRASAKVEFSKAGFEKTLKWGIEQALVSAKTEIGAQKWQGLYAKEIQFGRPEVDCGEGGCDIAIPLADLKIGADQTADPLLQKASIRLTQTNTVKVKFHVTTAPQIRITDESAEVPAGALNIDYGASPKPLSRTAATTVNRLLGREWVSSLIGSQIKSNVLASVIADINTKISGAPLVGAALNTSGPFIKVQDYLELSDLEKAVEDHARAVSKSVNGQHGTLTSILKQIGALSDTSASEQLLNRLHQAWSEAQEVDFGKKADRELIRGIGHELSLIEETRRHVAQRAREHGVQIGLKLAAAHWDQTLSGLQLLLTTCIECQQEGRSARPAKAVPLQSDFRASIALAPINEYLKALHSSGAFDATLADSSTVSLAGPPSLGWDESRHSLYVAIPPVQGRGLSTAVVDGVSARLYIEAQPSSDGSSAVFKPGHLETQLPERATPASKFMQDLLTGLGDASAIAAAQATAALQSFINTHEARFLTPMDVPVPSAAQLKTIRASASGIEIEGDLMERALPELSLK